jgi:hypothetical protein
MKTRFICAALGVLVLVAASATAQPIDSPRVAFAARLAAYAAMHREIAQQVSARVPFTDPEEGLAALARLREAIRATRPHAREGDFFAPMAGALRRDLWWTLREKGLEPRALMVEMLDDTEEGARPPVVNERFSWALGTAMPPSLIAALPDLPEELEYRLVGPHLVLIDIDANLVVDILRDALLDTTTVQ